MAWISGILALQSYPTQKPSKYSLAPRLQEARIIEHTGIIGPTFQLLPAPRTGAGSTSQRQGSPLQSKSSAPSAGRSLGRARCVKNLPALTLTGFTSASGAGRLSGR